MGKADLVIREICIHAIVIPCEYEVVRAGDDSSEKKD
jgi:hypothetical protein